MRRTLLLVLACVWPAAAGDVTGKWDFTAKLTDRDLKLELTLKNESGKLTGAMTSPNGSIALQDVLLEGDELSYKVSVNQGLVTVKLKVDGSAMKGTATPPDGTAIQVAATRAAAAGAGDVSGHWKVKAVSSGGREYILVLDLKNEGGKISGTLGSDRGAVPLTEVKLEGKDLSFQLAVDEGSYTVKLTLADAEMKGTYIGSGGNGTVTATR